MLDVNNLIMCAMKAHDKVASETYKLLKAKILEFKTAKNAKEYNDAEEINLINKMISDRKNTAEIYNQNNRKDLADAELAQADVLQKLLPKLPTEEDIKEYLNEYYPNGIEKKSMGIVIKEVKNALLGADGKLVSECVKSIIK
jgi:uncharacterized protein YqeY